MTHRYTDNVLPDDVVKYIIIPFLEHDQLVKCRSVNLHWKIACTTEILKRKYGNKKLIDLRHGQLTSVPPEIGFLQQLQLLNLSNNQLTSSTITELREQLPNCTIKI